MSAAVLLKELSREGVKVWAEDGQLRYHGPKKVLTPAVLTRLKEHKAEILEQLRPAPAATKAPEAPAGRDPCHHEIAGACWLCKKYGFKPLRPTTPTVAEVLENPPYWLRSYLRGFWCGSVSLYVLSGAVAAAMGLSPHQWAEEFMVEVEVSVPAPPEQPARAVAA
jgi:hypothetical protein